MTDKHKKDWKKFTEDSLRQQHESEEALDEELEEIETTPSADGPTYPELEERLTLAEQKAHENWEKSVRALAELDNVRRRSEREVSNAHRYGLEKFLNELLPVVDSLDQALQLAETEADKSMRDGLELTMKLFLEVLQKHEVELLDPMGQLFDPHSQEAMAMQESKDVPPNTVIAVFQKGFKLHDRVIRPARVVVSK